VLKAPAPDRSKVRSTGWLDIDLSGNSSLNWSQTATIGNLTLGGSSIFAFGNSNWTAALTIRGDIVVSGNATLRLWDSWVYFVGGYAGDRDLYEYGSAHVILDSMLFESYNETWDGYLYQESNLTVDNSAIDHWAVLQFADNSSFYAVDAAVNADVMPADDASVFEYASVGSHLWFPFDSGSDGTYSFPPPNLETTWSFPPARSTGFGYRVDLVEAWPGLCAVAEYPGANITIVNSSQVDAAFLPQDTTMNVSGLRFGPTGNFTFDPGQFEERFENVSIESWSFYPVATRLSVQDSQLGEVMGWGGSTMILQNSNLTDNGGFYSAFDTSTLDIESCLIGSAVVGYQSGSIRIANSTVLPSESVVAVGNSTISLFNVTMDPGSNVSAEDGGEVQVYEALTVLALRNDAPQPGAYIRAQPRSGVLVPTLGVTGPNGIVLEYLESELVAPSGNQVIGPFAVTASFDDDGAQQLEAMTGPTYWSANLTGLILGVDPVTGSRGVPTATNVSMFFGLSMNATSVNAALGLVPSLPYLVLWNATATMLTLSPAYGWPTGTVITVTVGAGALTEYGIPLPVPYVLTFATVQSTGPPTAPSVVSTTPSAGAENIGVDPTVIVQFSVPMDPNSTEAAFTISPEVPAEQLTLTGSVLIWTGSEPWSTGTTYAVTIAASAESTQGLGLGMNYSFSFTTLRYGAPPFVVTWDPANGSTVTDPRLEVRVAFSVPMDPASTTAAFSIVPRIEGTIAVSGANLTWKPDSPMPVNVTYTVEVGPTARSAAGAPLPGPVWSDFELREPGAPSSGNSPSSLLPTPLSEVGWAVALGGSAACAFILGYWLRSQRRPKDSTAKPPAR
jgi:hypothetical protein